MLGTGGEGWMGVSVWRNVCRQCHNIIMGICLDKKKRKKKALSAEHWKVNFPSGSGILFFTAASSFCQLPF